jgi:hypothetical protein
MNDERQKDEVLLRIEQKIREMPSLDPPDVLLNSVMRKVRTRKRPWWYRAFRWARSPRSITFTPLQLLPATSMFVAAVLVSAFYLWGGGHSIRGNGVPQNQGIPVTLSLNLPSAQRVQVVGTFNDWHARGYEMRREEGKESWTLTVRLPRGRYEYAFMVDGGKIVPDPGAGFYQDDGFGNRNAVLIVGNHDETNI